MQEFMIQEARRGAREGGIPIGAALVDSTGKLIANGRNRRIQELPRGQRARVNAQAQGRSRGPGSAGTPGTPTGVHQKQSRSLKSAHRPVGPGPSHRKSVILPVIGHIVLWIRTMATPVRPQLCSFDFLRGTTTRPKNPKSQKSKDVCTSGILNLRTASELANVPRLRPRALGITFSKGTEANSIDLRTCLQ